MIMQVCGGSDGTHDHVPCLQGAGDSSVVVPGDKQHECAAMCGRSACMWLAHRSTARRTRPHRRRRTRHRHRRRRRRRRRHLEATQRTRRQQRCWCCRFSPRRRRCSRLHQRRSRGSCLQEPTVAQPRDLAEWSHAGCSSSAHAEDTRRHRQLVGRCC